MACRLWFSHLHSLRDLVVLDQSAYRLRSRAARAGGGRRHRPSGHRPPQTTRRTWLRPRRQNKHTCSGNRRRNGLTLDPSQQDVRSVPSMSGLVRPHVVDEMGPTMTVWLGSSAGDAVDPCYVRSASATGLGPRRHVRVRIERCIDRRPYRAPGHRRGHHPRHDHRSWWWHHSGRLARRPAAGHVRRLALPGRGCRRRTDRVLVQPRVGSVHEPHRRTGRRRTEHVRDHLDTDIVGDHDQRRTNQSRDRYSPLLNTLGTCRISTSRSVPPPTPRDRSKDDCLRRADP
jgi:hypothetical protein